MTTRWNALDIPPQNGRTAIITGANSGIGLEAARELARAGARVVLACRNADKAAAAMRDLEASVPGAQIEVSELDLGSLASVRAFAERYRASGAPLDLLINNAGVMAPPRRLTTDGFELQIGTNHLGHFALTGLLLSLMHGRDDARVVTVASSAHRRGAMNFDDLHGEKSYGSWSAYSQSKLANLIFMFELNRRLGTAGSNVRSVAAHPGYAATNLQTAAAPRFQAGIMTIGNVLLAQSAAKGALPTLYAATHPDAVSGSYAGPDGMWELRGNPKLVGCIDAARDEAAAKRLWDVSSELTGVDIDAALKAPVV